MSQLTGGIEIKLPVDQMDASIKAYDESGKEVAVPRRICITPYFSRPAKVADVLFLRVLSSFSRDGGSDEFYRGVMQLPGVSGQLRLVKTGDPCVPQYQLDAQKDKPS